jgi:allantoinase
MGGPAIGRPDLLLRARQAVTADGIVPLLIVIADGVISGLLPYDSDASARFPGMPVAELARDEVLLPGLADTHVHVNEPGRTSWEGFATATAAAAAGGITSIVDMPLNCSPPTTGVAALEQKLAAASGRCHVDVGFWGGAVPGNEAARRGLHEAGVRGFKCFTIDSGLPEFPPLSPDELMRAARQIARLGSQLLVHAEDPLCVGNASYSGGPVYADFLRSRPERAETVAITGVIEAMRATGARTHIVHVSSAASLPLIAAARSQGLPVTAETCPHYLTLAAEDVPSGAAEFKCCPPVRERANRELLWEGLRAGIIDCVVSDHSPCPPALKRAGGGDFAAAWGGIASLQLVLPVTWTFARERGFGLPDVIRWTASAPAAMAGLPGKGAIAAGNDADLAAFAPDASFVVQPELLRHRHKLTPYAGWRLTGVVRRTWLRGREVVITADPASGECAGRLLGTAGTPAGRTGP